MSKELEDLRERVKRNLKMEVRWVKTWSFTYHLSLFGAVVLSAAAALLLQVGISFLGLSPEDSGAVLAAASALLGALAAQGGFRRKWETNRSTRGRLHKLDIDLMDDHADVGKARERLKEIWAQHDKGIIGAGAPDNGG